MVSLSVDRQLRRLRFGGRGAVSQNGEVGSLGGFVEAKVSLEFLACRAWSDPQLRDHQVHAILPLVQV